MVVEGFVVGGVAVVDGVVRGLVPAVGGFGVGAVTKKKEQIKLIFILPILKLALSIKITLR